MLLTCVVGGFERPEVKTTSLVPATPRSAVDGKGQQRSRQPRGLKWYTIVLGAVVTLCAKVPSIGRPLGLPKIVSQLVGTRTVLVCNICINIIYIYDIRSIMQSII